MKKLLAVVFAATASALWAMDPIRINFSDKEKYDVGGWQNVRYVDATNGVECVAGATMRVSGDRGWYWTSSMTNPLQHYYIDEHGWQSPTHVTFSNVPAGYYTITVYMASDSASGKYNPIAFNDAYYSYYEGKVLPLDDIPYEKRAWGDVSVEETVVGTNVFEMVDYYIAPGEVLDIASSRNYGRGSIAAVEIREHQYVMDTPSVISINVCDTVQSKGMVSSRLFVPGLAGGEIPGYSWLNVSNVENEFSSVAYWDGPNRQLVDETDIAVKVTAGNTFHNGSALGANAFLQYYLEDLSSPSISVTGIPFKLYDVIVYMNCDWVIRKYHPTSPVANAFNPVTVNGTQYTWDTNTSSVVVGTADWGTNTFATAILGTNALRIVGMTDSSLVVATGSRQNPARGGFAALQIVAHDYVEVVATGDITTGEVNAKAKGKKEVLLTMPAGATLAIQPKALDCDTLFIMSDGNVRIATKNNVEPAEGSVYAANLAKINTANVKGAAYHGWKPTKRIIAFNVMAERGAMPSTWDFNGALGAEEMPSVAWNNLYPSAGTNEVPVVWNGDLLTTNTIDGMTADWSGALYGWGSPEEPFRRGWFDGSQKTGKITVKNIPFEKYDVIVYMNWDGKDNTYGAPWVNGSQWTYDAETNQVVKGDARWGVTINGAKAELGLNAIRVPDQTDATCEIETSGSVCNICAVQIVEYCEKPHDPTQSFIFYVK